MPIDHAHLLRQVGLRVTGPRLAVLDAIEDNPHGDSATIVAEVGRVAPAISRQAVFDGLNALSEAGVIRRIQPAGSPARYELRVGDNHHHLVCRACGTVVDIDCAVGYRPCLTAADDHGFEITEAEVIYWGLCPNCAGADAAVYDSQEPVTEA
ncbi:MAG: Fur family transcriptional regulator [Nostocoides sp.]